MMFYRIFHYDKKKQNSPVDVDINKQGNQRHDIINKDAVLYLSKEKVSCFAEKYQYQRNRVVSNKFIELNYNKIVVMSKIQLSEKCKLLDLRDSAQLNKFKISPTIVTTQKRNLSQKLSLDIFKMNYDGFLWWSSIESLWTNMTLFKSRVLGHIKVKSICPISLKDDYAKEASKLLNITWC